jgi:dihydrofolate reductase
MTVDGFCDHTSGIADDEIHQHYTDLIDEAGVLIYGRITYQLMQSFWPTLVAKPSGEKSMDDFAQAIDRIPKIVFSHTLNDSDLGWETAKLANRSVKEEILALKQQPGKDILVGSPGMIVAATKLNLVDEYQLCVHPVVAGHGLPLFKNIDDKINFRLLKTKTFGCGAVIFYYDHAN